MFEAVLTRPSQRVAEEPGGLWSLTQAGLVRLVPAEHGPALVLVPTEAVLIQVVDLPLPGLEKKRQAAPFAVEELVSEPLDQLHVAVGAAVEGHRHLVGVVSHAVMADWVGILAEAGMPNAALAPDALALMAPPEGAWSVALESERVRIRTRDEAFAAPAADLAAIWAAAGRPRLVSYGQPLRDVLGTEDGLDFLPAATVGHGEAPALDLRQGVWSAQRRTHAFARQLAMIAGLAVAALVGVFLVDTWLIERETDQRKDELQRLVEARAPGVLAPDASGEEVGAVAERLVMGGGTGGDFLPVLSRAATALVPASGEVTIQSLEWDAAQGLGIGIEAADLSAIQAAEARLGEAGLIASNAGSTAENGRARGEIRIAAGDVAAATGAAE